MNYKPLGSRILVKVRTTSEVTVGGITLAVAKGVNKFGKAKHEFDEQVLACEVLKTGDAVDDVAAGDIVIIPGYAGKWVDRDLVNAPETHRIVDIADVIAIDLEATEKLKTNQEAAHVAA